MADSYNDHQANRDLVRRLIRNKDQEDCRYKGDDRYPEDDDDDYDDSRERYGYRRGHGSQDNYPRDDLDGRDFNELRDARDANNSRLSDVRDGERLESSKDSRISMRESESSREVQEGRDSRRGWDGKQGSARNDGDDVERFECANRNSAGDGREGDGYKNQAPNNTIMIRGLAQHITENDIRQDILRCGLMPKDIRLIRKKDTGASRGFAFVEFSTLQEASRWMEMKQGVLMLQEHYRAVMHFSIPKDSHVDRSSLKSSQDWHCIKCGAHNFKRRDACFKCRASRQESEGGEGSGEISFHPTTTVLLRGLDVLSTVDSVSQAVKSVSAVPVHSIRIGRDSLTNTSRGVCYLEMNHIMDAIYMHNALIATPPIVDGRKVLVSYCKSQRDVSGVCSSMSGRSVTVAAAVKAGIDVGVAQLGHIRHSTSEDLTKYSLEDVPRLADYCASLYAVSPAEYTAYQQYYRQYYQTQISQGSSVTSQTQADCVNAAAAVAQSAIQQVQAAKEIKKHVEDPHVLKQGEKLLYDALKTAQTNSSPEKDKCADAAGEVAQTDVANVPDVSAYQYDETSGYYYDPRTGLYYDASSQYFYNPQTQQFLYWDSDKQSYLPAPISSADSSVNKDEGKNVKEKERQEKVKVAKKIAKDMERWAKTLNQKKDIARQNLALDSAVQSSRSIGAADAGYAVLERKERPVLDFQTVAFGESEERRGGGSPSLGDGGNACGLVPAYGGGSESDEEIEDVIQEDRQHTNWSKLACLLCKRQFPTKESLIRHQQFSDLHKQNLEKWYRVRGLDPNDPQQRNNKYRDRAKERRQKFGEPNQQHPNHLKEKYLKTKEDAVSVSYEEPTKSGIGSDNVGNRLLQKMGWQEGMGLGKSNQGRTSVIQTEHRVNTAGLGARGGSYGALPGETYKDCVKKMMFARYQELTEQEHDS